jgi:hypothetical protein
MGKNKNDFEASGSGVKKEARSNRGSFAVDMAQLMHRNWMPRGNWRDVHMSATDALATTECLPVGAHA